MKNLISYHIFESSSRSTMLFEEFIPSGDVNWPTNWKEMPEWKIMSDLGFVETTTPIQRKHGTIMLATPKTKYFYPEGVYLTTSGYIRDKSVSSGFITKRTNFLDMFNYLIARYTKELKRNEKSEKTGPLTAEQIAFLNGSIKSSWQWNNSTKSVDVKGDVVIKKDHYNVMGTFKFGRVNGDFNIDWNGEDMIVDTLENFAPDYIGKDLRISFATLKNLKGLPEEMQGEIILLQSEELGSLEGLPMKAKRLYTMLFDVDPWNIDSAILLFTNGGGTRIQGGIFRKVHYSSKELDDIIRNMISPLLSPENLAEYYKNNPTEIHQLDDMPDLKKKVLDISGIKDLSRIGKLLSQGLI